MARKETQRQGSNPLPAAHVQNPIIVVGKWQGKKHNVKDQTL
jgi:hypothetical protein